MWCSDEMLVNDTVSVWMGARCVVGRVVEVSAKAIVLGPSGEDQRYAKDCLFRDIKIIKAHISAWCNLDKPQ